ncbi:MAG: DNA polymerase IV [Pseudomonadota bacterium]
MPALCRDCLTPDPGPRCPACGSPRELAHAELLDLSIAHLDCDAFYASVEKRDNPELRDRPVIVGGGRRGVVSTACYIARIRGVRSAMPMFKALDLCPDAAIVKPRMETYVAVSREIRALMEALTPAVEPLSLDEAFLDLTGTERLHGAPPAVLLALLQAQIEAEIGVTASIGLAPNKFLAKIASDLDKPRGFSVIGRAETESFLDAQPVSIIWGVGRAFQETLAADGIRTIPDLKARDRKDLSRRYGAMGERLWHLARGLDQRSVSTRSAAKSVSNETTFGDDTGDPDLLEGHLWRLAEKVADRLKAKEIAGRVVTLKLKRSNHRLLTRSHTLSEPTQMAHLLFETTRPLLRTALREGPFRLIGVGISQLTDGAEADRAPDLLDPSSAARTASERATDAIREKFGSDAIVKGRALR